MQAMTENAIVGRLGLNQINGRTTSALRQSRSLVLQLMPELLDQFYQHLGSFEQTSGFFKSRQAIAHAKAMQLKHWGVILEGNFDDAYEASVTRIGEVHAKIGLEPVWYIAGYNVLVSGLIRAVADSLPGVLYRSTRQMRTDLQAAIVNAAMLDMSIAISVYLEASRRERVATLRRLAGELEGAVAGVAAIVSSSAALQTRQRKPAPLRAMCWPQRARSPAKPSG